MLPFMQLPTRVLTDPAVGHTALRVYCLLAVHVDGKGGWCYPSLRTLGSLLGVDRTTVCRNISLLVRLKYVERAKVRLPSGIEVTAYSPNMDAPGKKRKEDLKEAATRWLQHNDRCAPRNARRQTATPTVASHATMEVETTKKKKDDLPVRLPSRWERRKPTGLTPLTEILDPVLEAELDKVFGPEGQPREA